jgi:hypothetical protein
MGIALLGICQAKDLLSEILKLGLHDEFTVYSAVAIMHSAEKPNELLWDLAKKLDGWGKVRIVDKLAELDISEEIREWLILEGYQNSVMDEYLAFTCAVNGKLNERLLPETISKKLFTSSGGIIDALINGGPAEDIHDYEKPAELIANYLRHAQKMNESLRDYLVVRSIKDYLKDLDENKADWSKEMVDNSLSICKDILSNKKWKKKAEEGLYSDDNYIYWNSKQVAGFLGINTHVAVWDRISNNPTDYSLWFDVANQANNETIDKIIDFADKNIPHKDMATGPRDSMMIGPEFQKYNALDTVITMLERFPGKGKSFILAGLDSPMTRNRNMCLRVLSSWGNDIWSKEIKNALISLEKVEPNSDTKLNIQKVLRGEKLSY